MRHKNQLPPNYQRIVDFILDDLGRTFTDTKDNISALAAHMNYQPRQIHAVLGVLTGHGVLSWSRKARAWTVVKTDTEAA